jgi:hypothetical protein
MRVALLLCAITLALCGCSGSQNPGEQSPLSAKIGQNCTVQLRRGDGLGAASGSPVPPTTNAHNGAEVCISGKLQAVAGSWIVVGADNRAYYIPRESILLIEVSK